MQDSLEHATGLEKREILARQAGIEVGNALCKGCWDGLLIGSRFFFPCRLQDPYQMQVYNRVAGTKDAPNLVPSVADYRVVGCVCEPDATCINWMWLYKGEPKRCECGYWYKLTEAKAI